MLGSYLLRLSAVTARTLPAPRVGALDEVRVPLRIWPTDVDIYFHVNNGRYLTLMDFGRLAHAVRTGLAVQMLRRGWAPVLGSATVHYWRELKVLDRVELVTRVACWDDKWFYIEHRFEQAGRVAALGAVKGVCRKGRQVIPPAQLFGSIGYAGPSPEAPAHIAAWREGMPQRPMA
jgi:acyl-CoA thioesterase FadM